MKIVTTHPIATDVVIALGQTPLLAAVSDGCRLPLAFQDLPRGPWTIDDSGALHTEGRFVDIVSALAPDFILSHRTSVDVNGRPRRKTATIGDRDVRWLTLAGADFDALWHEVGVIGEALGLGMLAAAIVAGLRGRLDDVARALAAADPSTRRLRLVGLPPLSEGELAWLKVLAGHARCGFDRDEDPAHATAPAAVVTTVAPDLGGQVIADVAVEVDPTLLAPGPRAVEFIEMIAAAAWPELVPSLRHRHAARLRVVAAS